MWWWEVHRYKNKKDKQSQRSNLLNALLNFQITQQSSQKTHMKDRLQTQLSTILLLILHQSIIIMKKDDMKEEEL